MQSIVPNSIGSKSIGIKQVKPSRLDGDLPKDGFARYWAHKDTKTIFQVSLGVRREARKTSACLTSVSLAIEVQEHLQKIRLGQRVILVYNMST